VNFCVIILCPVFVHQNLKKNFKNLKTYKNLKPKNLVLKRLGYFQPWSALHRHTDTESCFSICVTYPAILQGKHIEDKIII